MLLDGVSKIREYFIKGIIQLFALAFFFRVLLRIQSEISDILSVQIDFVLSFFRSSQRLPCDYLLDQVQFCVAEIFVRQNFLDTILRPESQDRVSLQQLGSEIPR